MNDEARSAKISIVLTPAMASLLDNYAKQNHWSRSTAAAVLIENGLKREAPGMGRTPGGGWVITDDEAAEIIRASEGH